MTILGGMGERRSFDYALRAPLRMTILGGVVSAGGGRGGTGQAGQEVGEIDVGRTL